jgi:hypothetical protein
LGTGPTDPTCGLPPWSAQIEWLSKRPSNEIVEIANPRTKRRLSTIFLLLCEPFSVLRENFPTHEN